MQEYVLIATMKSAADARAFKKELATFFATHAKQHDAASDSDDFEWPGKPTPAAIAFAAKQGTKWNDALIWGEEQLVGDEPSVAALENKLVVFHGFCSGGLSADLVRVMAKRSGKRVVVESAVPVIYCEATLDPKGKLARELQMMFSQREEIEHLTDWKKPSWAKKAQLLGESEQASFCLTDKGCRFTLPLDPVLEDAFLAHLSKGGAKVQSWRLATSKDIDTNQRAEASFPSPAPSANTKPAKPAKPAAIPKTEPTIELVRAGSGVGQSDSSYSGAFYAMTSTGKHLVISSGTEVKRWTGAKLETLAKNQTGLQSIFARGDTVWACGYGYVLHSTNAGKQFEKIQLLEDTRSPRHEDSPQLLDITCDDAGVVWVVGFGCRVMMSRDGKTFETLKPLDKVTVTRCVPSPYGLLVLKDNGRLQIARDGKLHQTTLRGKSPLYGACVTPSGTIVVVGHGDWKGSAFRSTDGVNFVPSKLAKAAPLYGVAALPDGRIIAGGHEDLLMVSYDDGVSFKRLAHELPTIERNFGLFCHHDDGVYVGGMFAHLIKVT